MATLKRASYLVLTFPLGVVWFAARRGAGTVVRAVVPLPVRPTRAGSA